MTLSDREAEPVAEYDLTRTCLHAGAASDSPAGQTARPEHSYELQPLWH